MKDKPLISRLGNQANLDILDVFHTIYEGVAAFVIKQIFLHDRPIGLRTKMYLGTSDSLRSLNDLIESIKVY